MEIGTAVTEVFVGGAVVVTVDVPKGFGAVACPFGAAQVDLIAADFHILHFGVNARGRDLADSLFRVKIGFQGQQAQTFFFVTRLEVDALFVDEDLAHDLIAAADAENAAFEFFDLLGDAPFFQIFEVADGAFGAGNDDGVVAVEIAVFIDKADVDIVFVLEGFHIGMVGDIGQAHDADFHGVLSAVVAEVDA